MAGAQRAPIASLWLDVTAHQAEGGWNRPESILRIDGIAGVLTLVPVPVL
jgi:hypothetical protein